MSERNRGDRGALVALGLILAAIVLVAFFETGARGPLNDQGGKGGDEAIEERSEGNISQAVARSGDFDFWQDPFPQWAMAFLAAIATGTGILGVIWIRQTLQATRDTAEAANEANRTAQRIGDSQVRAYVSLSKLTGQITREEPFMTISASMNNSGRTPARRISYKANLVRIARDGTRVITHESRIYDDPEDLLPDETRPIFNVRRDLTNEEKTDMERGRVRYTFEGYIHYWPVVGGQRRATQFSYAIRWIPKVTLSLAFTRTPGGNNAQ